MNKQKQIMLRGGQPVTVNFKWEVISQAEVVATVESIVDDTTKQDITDLFPQSDKDQFCQDALTDFYKV